MIHRIETNVPFKSATDIENVYNVLRRKVEQDVLVTFIKVCTPTGSNLVVQIEGNGAMLRDAAFALDCEGMLD